MKIVVTGGAGLTGRHLLADLAQHGHTVLSLDRIAAAGPWPSRAIDLCSFRDVAPALAGADAVIHLARIPFPYCAAGYDGASRTWPKPDGAGDAEKFALNVTMTNNVLAAAAAAGVRRVVMGSSLAAYGLYYPSRPLLPAYLPIDEAHPLRPDDPYGMTKLIGEDLAEAFVARTGGQVASLRFPGVSPGVAEEGANGFAEKRRQPMARGIGGLWTYVDVRDAATACRLAAETGLAGHQAFNICAPRHFMHLPTRELVRLHLSGVTDIRTEDGGDWAGYDTRKAASLLGFAARHTLPHNTGTRG